MKTINVCLIILFISIGISKSFEFSSLIEVQELKNNLFGSNLIETISLAFQGNQGDASSQEILQMLSNLRNDLQKDQQNDDTVYGTKKAQFDHHIVTLTKKINDLQAKIEALTREIARLTVLIAKADANILSFRTRITNLKRLLVELKRDNDSDNVYYKNRIEALGRVYNVFTRLVQQLTKLVGSASAAKVPTHVKLTAAEKRDIEYRRTHPAVKKTSFLQTETEEKTVTETEMLMSREYTNFLENTLNADQAALSKLIGLITKLQVDTLTKKTQTQAHLDNVNRTYLSLKKSTEVEVAANKKSLKSQRANRNLYVNQKAAAEKQKAAHEARRDLLKKERALNENLRKNLESVHLKEKEQRAGERLIVEKLMKIVETRLVSRRQ